LGSRRLVFAVLGAALAWLIGMAGLIVAGGDLGLLVPWALLLLVPCLNAGLWADEGFGR
jgi:hypothetical protein